MTAKNYSVRLLVRRLGRPTMNASSQRQSTCHTHFPVSIILQPIHLFAHACRHSQMPASFTKPATLLAKSSASARVAASA